uniref:Uncharacterized protein n=1 Tax=Xenopus tropicalis TaxID=8364 RepID=A0A1B8Y2R4_XENTR
MRTNLPAPPRPEFQEPGERSCQPWVKGPPHGALMLPISGMFRQNSRERHLGRPSLEVPKGAKSLRAPGPEFQEPGEGRAAGLGVPAQPEFQEPGEGRGCRAGCPLPSQSSRSPGKAGAAALGVPCPARVPGARGRTGCRAGPLMPSQSSRGPGKDRLQGWPSHAQPDQSSRSPGKDGLQGWPSHAQPEFQEPGEDRGCGAGCPLPSQSSRGPGKDGLQGWPSHAQPEFQVPGEGRAEALALSCPARVPGARGRQWLRRWVSPAQPEFQGPGEGRAAGLALPCPARVPGARGRTGCRACPLMPSQSSRGPGKAGAAALGVPCPARVPGARGRQGLQRWVSPAQPEFQKETRKPEFQEPSQSSRSPGKAGASALAVPCPARVPGARGRQGLQRWLSPAQPEFQEPGEGRAAALGVPCPARVPGARGRTGRSAGVQEPGEGRAEAPAVSCPARVPGARGRQGPRRWRPSPAQPERKREEETRKVSGNDLLGAGGPPRGPLSRGPSLEVPMRTDLPRPYRRQFHELGREKWIAGLLGPPHGALMLRFPGMSRQMSKERLTLSAKIAKLCFGELRARRPGRLPGRASLPSRSIGHPAPRRGGPLPGRPPRWGGRHTGREAPPVRLPGARAGPSRAVPPGPLHSPHREGGRPTLPRAVYPSRRPKPAGPGGERPRPPRRRSSPLARRSAFLSPARRERHLFPFFRPRQGRGPPPGPPPPRRRCRVRGPRPYPTRAAGGGGGVPSSDPPPPGVQPRATWLILPVAYACLKD